MALYSPIDRDRYKVTTVDHGNFKVLGTVSDIDGGSWRVQFVPDVSFVGSFAVVGRSGGPQAGNDSVAFTQIPYNRVSLNGQASDWNLVSDVLLSDFIINVPGTGLSVALLVECTAGFGVLYAKPYYDRASQ